MIKLRFVKLGTKWFVDLPLYEGDVNDMQMVFGADTMLELYSGGRREYEIGLRTDESDCISEANAGESAELIKLREDADGATYFVKSRLYRDELWLCPVTKYVFGEYPDTIKLSIY